MKGDRSIQESQRNVSVERIGEWWKANGVSCTEGVFSIGLRVPRYRASEKIYSTEKRKSVIKSRRHILQGHMAPQEKSGSQGVIQKCEPQERNPRARKFQDKTLQETSQQERCARREAWHLAKNVQKLKAKDKTTFCSPTLFEKARGSRIRGRFWSIDA